MIKLKPRTATLLALIVIAGIGTAVILLTYNGDNQPKSTKKIATQAEASTKTESVTAKPSDFNNKTITVTGRIIQLSNNGQAVYYVSGESPSQGQPPSAIKLEFDKSKIDIAAYAETPPAGNTQYSPKPAVTVSGTFKFDSKKSDPPVLVVDSIN